MGSRTVQLARDVFAEVFTTDDDAGTIVVSGPHTRVTLDVIRGPSMGGFVGVDESELLDALDGALRIGALSVLLPHTAATPAAQDAAHMGPPGFAAGVATIGRSVAPSPAQVLGAIAGIAAVIDRLSMLREGGVQAAPGRGFHETLGPPVPGLVLGACVGALYRVLRDLQGIDDVGREVPRG